MGSNLCNRKKTLEKTEVFMIYIFQIYSSSGVGHTAKDIKSGFEI
jgi:GTPase